MTLDDLRAERNEEWIGPAIYGIVAEICRRVAGSYNPKVYAGQATWADGLDDLVQEVILERMIEDGQLDYAVTVAVSIDDFRRLVTRQVKRTLARRRRRSVIDNLLDRMVAVLSRDPFEVLANGHRFVLIGAVKEDRDPTDAEIYEAAVAASTVPKTLPHATERAPVVYAPAALLALAGAIADALPTTLSLAALDRVLRLLLTDWLASDLVEARQAEGLPATRDLGPEEVVQVSATVAEILHDLPEDSLHVLGYKYADLSDGEIAGRLHLSRPTVAKRKEEALAVLRKHLDGTGDVVREAAVAELGLRIAGPK